MIRKTILSLSSIGLLLALPITVAAGEWYVGGSLVLRFNKIFTNLNDIKIKFFPSINHRGRVYFLYPLKDTFFKFIL